MSKGLTPDRFAEFFATVNAGLEPFPWQVRLVRQLFDTGGKWPNLLDLPTASGKTSTVEVALYTLAAGLPVPRRIIFVVDRRVIVQQAAVHAKRLRGAVEQGSEPIVGAIRAGLRSLHADVDEPRKCFIVAELRGAIQQDRQWGERPDVPAVIASTVDQVGSRLLFRGYGVSDRMLPVHAGLVANDALILLDEVHLARPFAQLLNRIKERYRPTVTGLPDRWQVVELSATPTPGDERTTFTLDDEDRSDPVLGTRFSARKPARLVAAKVPTDPDKAQETLARVHAEHVVKLLEHDRVRAVGVVVNRVRLAGLIRHRLEQLGANADLELLTGRMRGIERADVIQRVQDRVGLRASDRGEVGGRAGKFVVITTQTIEAGADLDFDAIVTDCASIDALIQRFGRVDRAGRLSASIHADSERPRSLIIGTNRLLKDRDDPIYGKALRATWDWLALHGDEVDFQVIGGDIPDAADRVGMLTPHGAGPIFTRSHLDRLVRTSPRPDADVDVDSFLHGLDHRPDQDVEIVWRRDISQTMLESIDARSADSIPLEADIADLMTALPPSALETLAVPVSQARGWLSRSRPDGQTPSGAALLADLETSAESEPPRGYMRPCVVWRSGECFVTTAPTGLRPGDTLIVPWEYGGIAHGNWDPASTTPVDDVAERAAQIAGRFRLRLNPATLDPMEFPASALPTVESLDGVDPQQRFRMLEAALARPTVNDDGELMIVGRIPTPESVEAIGESERDLLLQRWLRQFTAVNVHDDGRVKAIAQLQHRLRAKNVHVVTSEFGRIYVLSDSAYPSEMDSEPSRSSNIATPYPLDAHLQDVQRWVQALLAALGVGDDLAASIAEAGLLHDLGKADVRFQAYLREGEVATPADQLLAKSGIPAHDRARNSRARERAGYPPEARHEAASVALAGERFNRIDHPVLTRYLVASHHGYGRPFFPAQINPAGQTIEYTGELGHLGTADPYRLGALGSCAPDDFAGAVRRYGWCGLAWLEAVLRLADHGASRTVADRSEGRTSGGEK